MKQIIVLTLGLFLFGSLQAQVKIGYVDIDTIMKKMPELDSIQSVLQVKQKSLEERIMAKQQLIEQKVTEFQQRRQRGETTQKEEQEVNVELQKLQQELQQMAQESERELLVEQQKLLIPVESKIVKIIDQLREEKGYDMILSAVDANTGTRIVISAAQEANLTDEVVKRLGIK